MFDELAVIAGKDDPDDSDGAETLHHLVTNESADATDSLSRLFDYMTMREDRWRSLSRAAETEVRHPQLKSAELLEAELASMAAGEAFWAFPGASLLASLQQLLADGDIAGFAAEVMQISRALHTRSYRRDPSAREMVTSQAESAGIEADSGKPYFEVLIIGGDDLDLQGDFAGQLRALRDPLDEFVYECVTVVSLQDACVALLLNPELQAVVALDGFPYHSTTPMPELEEYFDTISVPNTGDLALPMLQLASRFRPELDLYLLVDRVWERVAGTADATHVRRIFFGTEEVREIHLSILEGVRDRYRTPFFDNLTKYARRPIGTYHALPLARGKSLLKSNWIRDMGQFYGENLFLAESSATTGGLDSLLDPKGNIKEAQQLAARAFGADHAFYATNGTSTSNKIVAQAVCRPGDIVLIDRDCHKSHHYACVLTGAQPYYIDAFGLPEYSMYGGVPIARVKAALLELAADGLLERVRMVVLTNATFDGHMSHTKRLMMECLAIKPDLIFLWDEAWSASARFSPYFRQRTAMGGAEYLRRLQTSADYRKKYAEFAKAQIAVDGSDPRALTSTLLPNPDTMHVRVYQTTSVHKSMSALRQASIVLVADQLFGDVHESFREAFFTHTSTSPNQQIIATLDVARRQMELEGFELVTWALQLAVEMRALINTNPLISTYFRALTPQDLIPAEYRIGTHHAAKRNLPGWWTAFAAMDQDEFVLDLTRVTVMCGGAGLNGEEFKQMLAAKYDIQINKTSRNSVLFQININNTRGDIAHVIKVLADISRDLDQRRRASNAEEIADFEARVARLTGNPPHLPDFSSFHAAFRDNTQHASRHGHLREAFFLAYEPRNCWHIKLDDPNLDEMLAQGDELVGASFVIPYPPGFPVIVPGQVITAEIVQFMRALDVTEIHGYDPHRGLTLFTSDALTEYQRQRPVAVGAHSQLD